MLRLCAAACVIVATLCTFPRPWGLQWKLPSMLESDTMMDACIKQPSVLCRLDTSPAIILNTSIEGSLPPPWAARLLDRWHDLKSEAASLPAELFVEYGKLAGAFTIPEWRVFALRMAGVDVQPFRALAPKVAAVVDELQASIGPGLLNVAFSMTLRGGHITPHCDGADGRYYIRYQLVLNAPQPAAQFRICDQGPFLFQEGSLFAFNNSKPHEVINWAKATTLVLIVDVATSFQGLDLHNSITHMRQAFANDLPTMKRLNLMHELWNKFGTDVKQRAKFIEKLRKSLDSKDRVAELWAIANATLGSHGLDWRQPLHVQYGLDEPAQPTRPRPTSSSTAQLAVGAVLIASLAWAAHYRMRTIAGGSGVEDRLCTVSYYCQRLAGIALCLVWLLGWHRLMPPWRTAFIGIACHLCLEYLVNGRTGLRAAAGFLLAVHPGPAPVLERICWKLSQLNLVVTRYSGLVLLNLTLMPIRATIHLYDEWVYTGGRTITVVAWCSLAALLHTSFCITVNLASHRYFAHRSFRAGRCVQAVLGMVAASNGQGGPLEWVSTHTDHHRHCETASDPHSPKVRGLLGAHVLWLTRHKYLVIQRQHLGPFAAFPELWLCEAFSTHLNMLFLRLLSAFLSRYVHLPGETGAAITALAWSSSVHATSLINSWCHARSANDGVCAARDVRWVALLTAGEGWHKGHHEDPSCAHHGYGVGFDLTYTVIRLLERLGSISGVRHKRVQRHGHAD